MTRCPALRSLKTAWEQSRRQFFLSSRARDTLMEPPPPPPPPPQKPATRRPAPLSAAAAPASARAIRAGAAGSLADAGPGRWLLADHQVEPELQVGPTCGLVALSVAAASIRARSSLCLRGCRLPRVRPVQELLEDAVGRGFTFQGEMFSATHLAALARDSCNLCACVVEGASTRDVCEMLAHGRSPSVVPSRAPRRRRRGRDARRDDGSLVLVPYDADKDNSPCLLGGTRAHWALVRGLAVPPSCCAEQELLLSVDGGLALQWCCREEEGTGERGGLQLECACSWCSDVFLGVARQRVDRSICGDEGGGRRRRGGSGGPEVGGTEGMLALCVHGKVRPSAP